MFKRLLLVLVCLGWLVAAASAPAQADVQRVGDPPPMLSDGDQLRLLGAAVVVIIGLGLVAWSLRPGRPRVSPSLHTDPEKPR